MNNNQTVFYVGSRIMQIEDESLGISFPVFVQYPTLTPSRPTVFGPYTMDVSPDADIADGQFPLAVISHGNSGYPLAYRTISTFLAQNGYVVAMPEHYGNNRNNNDLALSIENLQYRPRHISLTINGLLSNKTLGHKIQQEQIAVIGHSFGGYTALALAGGKPWTETGVQVKIQKDSRIRVLVLMAPAAPYFIPDHSLDEVHVPILLLIAEKDEFTPRQWTADVILEGVPDKSKVSCRAIENAGHFSFISPFPESMQNPDFLPSTDPEGFDRMDFHRHLPTEILLYLNDHLKKQK